MSNRKIQRVEMRTKQQKVSKRNKAEKFPKINYKESEEGQKEKGSTNRVVQRK